MTGGKRSYTRTVGTKIFRAVMPVVLAAGVLVLMPLGRAATFGPGCTGEVGDAVALATAITSSNSNTVDDTIELVGGCTYTISETLVLGSDNGHSLTIAANGATIRRDPSDPNPFRLVSVNASADVTLSNVILTGGAPAGEGGAINNGGTVTITNSVISGNTSTGGGGIHNAGNLTLIESTVSGNSTSSANFYDGGGIHNNHGTLTVLRSTISGNTATNAGGGIMNHSGTATITNSTITGNDSGNNGGGVFNTSSDSPGTITILNSTISGNDTNNGAGSPGGIHNSSGSITATNTIVSDNGGTNCVGVALGGSTNLSNTSGCGRSFLEVPVGLQALADNGGPTFTMALGDTSAAIDAGDDDLCPTTDQRGTARPQGAHCDIGAYEQESGPELTVTKSNNLVDDLELGSGFVWSLEVANEGDSSAEFLEGAVVLSDDLEAAWYGGLDLHDANLDCSLGGFEYVLACTAGVGGLTLDADASLQVSFDAILTEAGSLDNPRSGGSCEVDPGDTVDESDETNNTCSDSVEVVDTTPPDARSL